MKIIITGALGHIGSSLLQNLPEIWENTQIVLIDNLSTERYSSLFDLPSYIKYEFIQADVSEYNFDNILQDSDVLIHLAAMTDAANSFKVADKLAKNNILATKNVALACIKHDVPMIFPSSTSVYGTTDKKVDERCDKSMLKPQSPYAQTKLKEEELLYSLHKNKGLRVAILRFGTIYGFSKGIRFHTAVNKFCWQAALGTKLTVWSTALNQLRPYLSILDVTRSIDFIYKNNLFSGEIYNVVSGNHTVADVIESIKVHIPNLDIELVDAKIMNQLSYEVCNTKLNDLGFYPIGTLSQGVTETLDALANANYMHRGLE